MEELYHDPLIFNPIATEYPNYKLPPYSFTPITTAPNAIIQSHHFFDMDSEPENLYTENLEEQLSTSSSESTPGNQEFESPEVLSNELRLKKALQSVPMTPFKRRLISDPAYRNNQLLCRKLTVRCPARGCGRVFQRVKEAVCHFDDHNEEEKNKAFLCPYKDCPWGILGLSSKPSLCRHIGTIHEGHTIRCQRCSKEFKRIDGLIRHEQKNKCVPNTAPELPVKAKTQAQLNDEMFDALQGVRI